MYNQPLICAIATPKGFGGISIIRLSGSGSWDIVNSIFSPAHSFNQDDIKGFSLHYGHIIYNGKIYDEVLLAYMKENHSYTGEEMAEIQCHGGMASASRIMDLLFSLGVQLADPGEFTKRAFLRGRIDLSQAEAVIEMIHALDEKDLDYSMTRLKGEDGRSFLSIRDDLLKLIAETEAVIDFPEDGLEDSIQETINTRVKKLSEAVDREIAKAETGKIFHNGISTAIVGRTNVGKSSLLNSLLNEERAIVTDIPGTTRDVIEETILLDGIPLVLTDTAGIRDTDDPVEKIGVRRSIDAISRSDLVLFVTDHTDLDEEERQILDETTGKKVLLIFNKEDIVDYSDIDPGEYSFDYITLSAANGSHIECLGKKIKDMFLDGAIIPEDREWTGNLRHKEIFLRVRHYLQDAEESGKNQLPLDFRVIDLRCALDALGEISGETISDEILDRIFSDFCIGK